MQFGGGKGWWSQGTIVEWRNEQQQIITWTQVRHSIHTLRNKAHDLDELIRN